MGDFCDYYCKLLFGTWYEYTTQHSVNRSKVIEDKNPVSNNYKDVYKTRSVIDTSWSYNGYTTYKYERYVDREFDNFNYEKVYNIEVLTNDYVICIRTNCKNERDADSLHRILPAILDIRTRWCFFNSFKFQCDINNNIIPSFEFLRERYEVSMIGESTHYFLTSFLVVMYSWAAVCFYYMITIL
jgi:hypothetical protein